MVTLALLVLEGVSTGDRQSQQVQRIMRIAKRSNASYADYFEFISATGKDRDVQNDDYLKFIEQEVTTPKGGKVIDPSYIDICWYQLSWLRNAGKLTAASEVSDRLRENAAKCDPEDLQRDELFDRLNRGYVSSTKWILHCSWFLLLQIMGV